MRRCAAIIDAAEARGGWALRGEYEGTTTRDVDAAMLGAELGGWLQVRCDLACISPVSHLYLTCISSDGIVREHLVCCAAGACTSSPRATASRSTPEPHPVHTRTRSSSGQRSVIANFERRRRVDDDVLVQEDAVELLEGEFDLRAIEDLHIPAS